MSYAVSIIGWWLRILRIVYRCFLESRPTVQGIFLLRFLTGASFAGPVFAGGTNLSLWIGAGLCVCATLSIYILNGVMDIREDRINGSSRPVARGELAVVHAAGVAVGLAVLSVVGGFALAGSLGWNITLALVLGWVYSGPPWHLKRWPAGLAVVAMLGGLLIYHAGYAANGGGGDVLSFCIFAGVMALWMGLVGQTKDLSDIEGDKQAGRKSAPVVWGEDAARLAISAVALLLGGGNLALALFLAPDLLIEALTLMFGALAVAVVALGSWSRGEKARRRIPYRAFMLAQYGTHLAAVIW